MTRISRDYRIRVATLGATDVTGNVGFTIDSVGTETDGFLERTGLSRAQWGGQDVQPLEGRTVSRPWTITIGETQTGEEFTTHLADTDDRSHLMRRLVDISMSEDGGSSWTVQATARISEIREVGGAYELTMMDERLVERETTIFTQADTTCVYPMGLRSSWAGHNTVRGLVYEIDDVLTTGVEMRLVGDKEPARSGSTKLTTGVNQLIVDDLDWQVDTSGVLVAGLFTAGGAVSFTQDGMFDHLRAELEPKNASVTPSELKGVSAYGMLTENFNTVGEVDEDGHHVVNRMGLFWDGSDGDAQPSVGDTFYVRLVMPTHEPTRDLPLHVGGDGTHAVQVAKDILQGTYSDAGDPTPRIDTTAFDSLIDDKEIPETTFRITERARMDQWIEQHIWQPFGIVPMVNNQGQIAPKKVMQTTADEVPDPTTLTNLTDSVVTEHPAWRNATNEFVTELVFKWQEISATAGEPDSSDGFIINDQEVTETHDRKSTLGTRSVEISLAGIHEKKTVTKFAKSQAKRLFNRFGDGPIFTEQLPTLKSAESLTHGEFVIVSVPTYPNLVGSTRGGNRMLQVIGRSFSAQGPTLDLLDAGPETQPLAAPSVSCTQNVDNPKSALDVTVSSLPTVAGYLLQSAVNATEPAANSDLWVDTETGDGDETVTVDALPSNSTIWFRARSVAPNRISSLWSTATSCSTNALSAPTGLASANVTGCSFDLSWTLGENDYSLEVTLDGTVVLRLRPGTTEAELHDGIANIEVSTGYTVGVRHVDGFGGESPLTTISVTTTATPDTGPTPLGIVLLAGRETNVK